MGDSREARFPPDPAHRNLPRYEQAHDAAAQTRAEQLLELQRAAGNQAVARALTLARSSRPNVTPLTDASDRLLARMIRVTGPKKSEGEKQQEEEEEDLEQEEEEDLEAEEAPVGLVAAAQALIESANGELGPLIGAGGFGSVHEVPGRPDLLVKIATGTGGAPNAQLDKEAESLQMLQSAELPTAFIGVVTWKVNGEVKRGLLMRRVRGSFSKKVLKLGKFREAQPTEEEIAAISEVTVRDLEAVRDKCLQGVIDIEDLQFMIDAKDGSIKLIDPARASHYTPSRDMRQRDIKDLMKGFEKRMNLIIRKVEEIAKANAQKG